MTITRPNVLFIVMDTARAQSTLPSENPGIMPNLESFQDEATTFSDAITSAPWTLPSHASMFTGQYTTDHETNAGSVMFEPRVTPLAEQLRQSGYETMAVSNNTWISPEFGFDSGFDYFYCGWELLEGGVDLQGIVRDNNSRIQQFKSIVEKLTLKNLHKTILNTAYAWGYHRRFDYGAKFTNYRINRLLSKTWDQSRPFFLFVNYLEPHLTYDPPKPYRYEHVPDNISQEHLESVDQEPWEYLAGNVEMTEDDFCALKALYEGELSYLDHRLGQLFDFLQKEGIFDETLIFIVGDHGENIGNHSLMDHQYWLYDTLLRVPLIIRYPDSVPEDTTVQKQVEVRDTYPTVLDACGLDAPEEDGVSSHSLLKYLPEASSTAKARDHAFAEYLVPQPDIEKLKIRTNSAEQATHLDSFDRSLRCVRTEDWKLIRASDGQVELYNLESDPDESEDVKHTHPEVVSELSEVLDAEFDSLEKGNRKRFDEMSSSTRSQLEELGYV